MQRLVGFSTFSDQKLTHDAEVCKSLPLQKLPPDTRPQSVRRFNAIGPLILAALTVQQHTRKRNWWRRSNAARKRSWQTANFGSAFRKFCCLQPPKCSSDLQLVAALSSRPWTSAGAELRGNARHSPRITAYVCPPSVKPAADQDRRDGNCR